MNNIYDPLKISHNAEWTTAIYTVVRILTERKYLHIPNDVEFVRPGYKPVLPCRRNGPDGSLELSQLRWAAEHGKFWFLWYEGTYLKLSLQKDSIQQELKLDPIKEKVWDFVHAVDDRYK